MHVEKKVQLRLRNFIYFGMKIVQLQKNSSILYLKWYPKDEEYMYLIKKKK